jgi:hypothetical protein
MPEARKLAAIAAADVVGYGKLAGAEKKQSFASRARSAVM